jgi:hypothetical protein
MKDTKLNELKNAITMRLECVIHPLVMRLPLKVTRLFPVPCRTPTGRVKLNSNSIFEPLDNYGVTVQFRDRMSPVFLLDRCSL